MTELEKLFEYIMVNHIAASELRDLYRKKFKEAIEKDELKNETHEE